MNESQIIDAFRAAMAEHDIHVSAEIIADGKFHRVHVDGDKKLTRNGWYCLHLDGKPAGAFGCNRRYGNDAKFTWSSKEKTKPLTAEERRAYRQKMERQKAERDAQEAATRAAAAERAAAVWAGAAECTEHPYLTRKGVKSHGLRVGVWEKTDEETGEVRVISKQALLIPIRDAAKKIHSLQAIFTGKIGDRDKDFLKNGAKSGLFYSFGKPVTMDVGGTQRAVILIGEGYATMATAHEVTGHAVIVAFDAGNLGAVGLVLRARFPDAHLVFLADNDRFTLTPIENPGVHHARRAAAAVGGVVAIPQFPEDAQGKPTDFNDLAAISGEDAVRDTIAEAINPPDLIPDDGPLPWEDGPEPAPMDEADAAPPKADAVDGGPANNGNFKILGYNRGTYFIFQYGKRQIAEITKGDMGEIGLIELAPLNWWEIHFPGERTKIDTKQAAEFIIRTAELRGIYDPDRVRGRGAWIDNGRIVYHHGDCLTVDGRYADVTDIDSRYVYELDRALPAPADEALTDYDGQGILALAQEFRWEKPCSAVLAAGYVALAPLCGALNWRPHIWITGGAGCGKTTVLDKYISYLTAGQGEFANGNSTEAGIRQKMDSDARPVLFDESESNEEGDARRIQNILSMIRQSSSETGARTFKGTAGGQAQHFSSKSMYCLSSIQVAIKQQADVERVCVLALKPKRDDKDSSGTWSRISSMLRELHADTTLPARLLRRSINLLPITLKNIVVFSNAAGEFFGSQRDGDQYGALLAGAWSLISSEFATKEQALELIKSYDWSQHRENNDTDEGQRALASLLGAHIRVKGGQELTVYELVCAAYGDAGENPEITQPAADATLQRYGMKVRGDRLLLANHNDSLRKLMAGTTYEADYRGVLLRVAGADRNDNKPTRFAGANTKCFSLPLGPIVTSDRQEPAF